MLWSNGHDTTADVSLREKAKSLSPWSLRKTMGLCSWSKGQSLGTADLLPAQSAAKQCSWVDGVMELSRQNWKPAALTQLLRSCSVKAT